MKSPRQFHHQFWPAMVFFSMGFVWWWRVNRTHTLTEQTLRSKGWIKPLFCLGGVGWLAISNWRSVVVFLFFLVGCCRGSMLDTFDEACFLGANDVVFSTVLELMLKRCWSLVQFLCYVWLHLYFHVLFSCVVHYMFICLVRLTDYHSDTTLLHALLCYDSVCPVCGWNDDCCCWWSMFVAILPVLLVIAVSGHAAGVGGSGAVVVFIVQIFCHISLNSSQSPKFLLSTRITGCFSRFSSCVFLRWRSGEPVEDLWSRIRWVPTS